jgi:hypothetical protein
MGLTDTFKGLNAEQLYNWRVRANCDADSSNYTEGDFTTSSGAGIQMNYALQAQLYPDPAADKVFLKFNSRTAQRVEIRLVSATGAAVFGSRFDATSGENISELNVETLANGTYILQLRTQEGWSYKQFIIQR